MLLALLSIVALASAHGGNNHGDDDDDGGHRASSSCRKLPPNAAIKCRRNEDCGCVSERSGYATCRLGMCYCNPKQGFDGTSLIASICLMLEQATQR